MKYPWFQLRFAHCSVPDIIFSYDNTTGVFTVPPRGDGMYYFSTFLEVSAGETAVFKMMLNSEQICSPVGDGDDGSLDNTNTASCTAVIQVAAGSRSIQINIHQPFPLNLFNTWAIFFCMCAVCTTITVN